MQERLAQIKREVEDALFACQGPKDLESFRVKYLGRSGLMASLIKNIKELPSSQRPEAGKKLNELKQEIFFKVEECHRRLKELKDTSVEALDVTLPGIRQDLGTPHPITQAFAEINRIFLGLGFKVIEGPEAESEYYNFEALNIPADHPSRESFDTFYLDNKSLLRSHTSPVQVRVMELYQPPIKIVVPGKAFRRDALDASHSFMFHQIEGLLVGEGVSFSNLKAVLLTFAKEFFGEETSMRFRPHFFPFTEPSAEADISCHKCRGSGCRLCAGKGWIEVLGAGMVDPEVFRHVGIDSEKFSGFAFGMGVDRMAMLKYGIDDIRLFFENDLRFLKQF